MTAPSPLRASIRALAARPGGVRKAEVQAASPDTHPTALRNLLTRMRVGRELFHDAAGSHLWFASAEQAAAYVPTPDEPARGECSRSNKGKVLSPRKLAVIEMAARDCGVTNEDIQERFGLAVGPASSVLGHLTTEAKLFKGNPARPVHYFATAAAAEQDRARHKVSTWPKARPRKAPRGAILAAPVPRVQNVRAVAPEGPAIVPPHVKVQVLPCSPTWGRHALAPDTRVLGGFATAGIGRYLDAPGCAAARAASRA